MMLFHLVKKDFLIVKKYVLLMLVVSILIPPFMLWRVPQNAGIMSFVLSIIFSVFMLQQYVSLKENQYPKASMLLCATPYPRHFIVLSKYCFVLIIYVTCCLIFWIETLFISELNGFSIEVALIMLLVVSIFEGIYLPVQYKIGYDKTKFVFAVVIMVSPFLLPLLLKISDGMKYDFIANFPSVILLGGTTVFSLIFLVVSAFVSIRIYRKTDLA